MKSILVAVDGSEHSNQGITEAAAIAKARGFTLELVNVLPPVLLAPGVYAEAIVKVEEGNREVATKILAAGRKVAQDAGIDAETVMLSGGSPAEAIAELAEAERVWGVVVGAKGHGAVARVLLGSVTDRLVHVLHKPVLVVR
jgi:nucleotide-binding universal stress UspA family protein